MQVTLTQKRNGTLGLRLRAETGDEEKILLLLDKGELKTFRLKTGQVVSFIGHGPLTLMGQSALNAALSLEK
jgi:hypothetical protein